MPWPFSVVAIVGILCLSSFSETAQAQHSSKSSGLAPATDDYTQVTSITDCTFVNLPLDGIYSCNKCSTPSKGADEQGLRDIIPQAYYGGTDCLMTFKNPKLNGRYTGYSACKVGVTLGNPSRPSDANVCATDPDVNASQLDGLTQDQKNSPLLIRDSTGKSVN